MRDVTFLRRKYRDKTKPYAHSSYIALDRENNIVREQSSGVCYSGITYSKGVSIDKLFLFLGQDVIDRAYLPELFTDWLINESYMADAFITKDVKEGYELGFEIDTSQEISLVYGAMIAFRYPYEQVYWSWSRFFEMGYDEIESLALATNYKVDDGNIYGNSENSNHFVVQRKQKFSLYEGKGYIPTKNWTLKEGTQGIIDLAVSIWGSSDEFVCEWYIPEDIEGVKTVVKTIETAFSPIEKKVVELNKHNVDCLLKHLKGIK